MPDPEVVKEPTTSDKINSYVDALPENDDATPAPAPVPEPVKQPEKAPEAQPPAAPASTEPPVKQPEAPATEPAKETPVPAAEPTPADDKLLAGRFENTYDLEHAVLEEVKTLKLDKKDAIALFDEARKSGDYSKVVEKYKELQGQVDKQIEEQKKNEPPKPEPQPAEPPVREPVEPELTQESVKQIVLETSYEDFGKTEFAQWMKDQGIEVPTTDEQLAALAKENRPVYREFLETFGRIVQGNRQRAEEFQKSEKEAPSYNNSQKEKAKQQIIASAKELDIELKSEEVTQILDEASKSREVYEDKNGTPYIRDGAIVDYFMARRYPKLVGEAYKKMKTDILTKGRAEGAEAVIAGKTAEPARMSTSAQPPVVTKPGKIDFSDPKQAKAAGLDAIGKRADELIDAIN